MLEGSYTDPPRNRTQATPPAWSSFRLSEVSGSTFVVVGWLTGVGRLVSVNLESLWVRNFACLIPFVVLRLIRHFRSAIVRPPVRY